MITITRLRDGTPESYDVASIHPVSLGPIIDQRASESFSAAIAAGYTTASGITMQCAKRDYEMLRDGLQTYLEAPVVAGGAGGDTSAMVEVIDRDNNPHAMTVAAALQLADEVRQYFWQLWARKNRYRQALAACSTLEEMAQVVF